MTLDQFYMSRQGVSLMWMGNDGWVINLHGAIISTDLDLCLDIRVPLPENVDIHEMARHIQVAYVTHAHGDHFNEDTCLMLAAHSTCQFVVPKSCCQKATEIGLPDDRVVVATPGTDFEIGGVKVHPVRALHGHFLGSIYSGASLCDCGYVFERRGFRIYQPGDTVLLEEHFYMKDIDVAFVSPTEHNMHIENSVRYLQMLDPRHIVPQHHSSYITTEENAFCTKGFVDEVYQRLSPPQQARFHRAKQGEPFIVE